MIDKNQINIREGETLLWTYAPGKADLEWLVKGYSVEIQIHVVQARKSKTTIRILDVVLRPGI